MCLAPEREGHEDASPKEERSADNVQPDALEEGLLVALFQPGFQPRVEQLLHGLALLFMHRCQVFRVLRLRFHLLRRGGPRLDLRRQLVEQRGRTLKDLRQLVRAALDRRRGNGGDLLLRPMP